MTYDRVDGRPRAEPPLGQLEDSDNDSVASSLTNDSTTGTIAEASKAAAQKVEKTITHRIRARGSILTLIVDDDCLIAGLEGGDIVAWSLDTYELILAIHAHAESVLSLYLSNDGSLLFSSGVDSTINVWSMHNFERLYCIYSHHDVGDLFSVVYSSNMNTLFCGAQNQSVQWYNLQSNEMVPMPSSPILPSRRKHRFFDSLGPGGTKTALPVVDTNDGYIQAKGGRTVSFSKSNYHPYAHDSYIYCMLLVQGLYHHDSEEEVLVTGGGDGMVKLWSIDGLDSEGILLLHKFRNETASVLSMAHSGTFLYVGLSRGVVKIYNLDSRQLVQKINVGCGDISAVQVIRGAVYCGTSLGFVKQFDSQFSEIGSWVSNNGKILASAIAKIRGRDVYVTGGNDDSVAFWDVTSSSYAPSELRALGNDELVNSLRDFVAYKTVAANPRYAGECNEALAFLRKLFNLFHAQTALLSIEDGVNPVILAKFEASDQPQKSQTVMFYGHYDVVEAEYDSGNGNWNTDPFQLHPLNGYLYGRGVTDNKGPILAALYAVADLVQHKGLNCNVVFLIEGEEEAGSRGFSKTIQGNRDRIGEVDCILLANSYWLDDHIPCLTYGMRGVIHASLTVSSDLPDRHSGIDGKATLHEPLKDLTTILGSLIGPSGRGIAIPGFYDSVSRLSPVEYNQYAAITAALMPGHPEIEDARAFTESLAQKWREPNLTIHRVDVPESKTAVTISRLAKASLSVRIVPKQDAGTIAADLTKFAKDEFAKLRSKNHLDISIDSKADAWLGDRSNEIFQTLESAIIEVWNPDLDSTSQRSFPRPTPKSHPRSPPSKKSHRRASSLASIGSFTPESTPRKPLYIREGGSIPAISFLEREFDAPAAMFPCGQASDNAHLENERMRLENLYKAREVFKRVFSKLPRRQVRGKKPARAG